MIRDNFINLPDPGARARVNEFEKIALDAIAKFEGMRVSEAIRLAIREAAKSRGVWPGQIQKTGEVRNDGPTA